MKKKVTETIKQGCFTLSQDGTKLIKYHPNGSGKVVIPEGVTSIDPGAFNDCDRMTELIIPEGVTDLPPFALREAKKLHTLRLPNSMKHIGYNCLEHCYHLYYVTMPSHMIVGMNAFPNRLIVLYNFLRDRQAGLLAKLAGKI